MVIRNCRGTACGVSRRFPISERDRCDGTETGWIRKKMEDRQSDPAVGKRTGGGETDLR